MLQRKIKTEKSDSVNVVYVYVQGGDSRRSLHGFTHIILHIKNNKAKA